MKLDRIPPRGAAGHLYHVVIETCRGSRNKYGYVPELGAMILKKVLPEGHVFPFDFGFVPRTRGADGDPLDVLVMLDEPTFAGCVVECRLAGVLQAQQSEKGKLIRNDRFIAVAESSLNFKHIRELRDAGPIVLEQIRHFFASYNEMAGREFKVVRTLGAAAARRQLDAAIGVD